MVLLFQRSYREYCSGLAQVSFKANVEPKYNVLEAQLNLLSFEARRKHRYLQMLYKIINGSVCCSDLLRTSLALCFL